eukprot:3228997-Rhodomonas_salina.2
MWVRVVRGVGGGAGVWRRHHLGKRFLLLGTTLAATMFVATAIGYTAVGKYRESVAPWSVSLSAALLRAHAVPARSVWGRGGLAGHTHRSVQGGEG